MLKNVLEDYLKQITKERDFDYPLLSLLHAMGFYNIHFTHGNNEIGKDFIARKLDEGLEYQYAIQSKKGDIKQAELEQIQNQLFLASLSGLSHPEFDRDLPRKVVLVTTGRLAGTAANILQDFNNVLVSEYRKEPIKFWGKDYLIPKLEEFGLTGIHQNTASGLRGFAQFYLNFSKAIDGNLSDKEIEEFSRSWLDESLDRRKMILRASLEAEIINSKLIERGFLYEALITYLALARTVMSAIYEHDSDKAFLVEIYKEIVKEKVLVLCKLFLNQFKKDWKKSKKILLHLCMADNPFPMIQYLVWCNRVIEVSALFYFLSDDNDDKKSTVIFLLDFLKTEEGCGHIPGDKYATTIVWVTLMLLKAKKYSEAQNFIKKSLIWLCDKTENGFGLARYEADEYEETATILGYPFEFIKVDKNTGSFLATILADLAAFSGEKQFYSDIINDVEACEISYNYWQFPDTKALFTIDTDECLFYPNIPHQDTITKFDDFEYSFHLKDEPKLFSITETLGNESLLLISVLLKDRYFPTLWQSIVTN